MNFALDESDVSVPAIWIQVVFLDDIGANLKPARDLGMVTILVHDTDTALAELERVTGVQVTLGVALGWVSHPSSWVEGCRRHSK